MTEHICKHCQFYRPLEQQRGACTLSEFVQGIARNLGEDLFREEDLGPVEETDTCPHWQEKREE